MPNEYSEMQPVIVKHGSWWRTYECLDCHCIFQTYSKPGYFVCPECGRRKLTLVDNENDGQ